MNKDRILSLIKYPGQTVQQDKQLLSDLIAAYPYFQIAHLLLLHNLNEQKDEQFNRQLKESAIAIPDRRVLFNLLYYPSHSTPNPSVNSMELLEIDETDLNTTIDMEKSRVVEFDMTSVSSEKYETSGMEFDLEENTSKNDTQTQPQSSSSFDLIEKFIETNPAFTPNRLDLSDQHEDISVNSIQEDEELATEALASVYISQKLYDKAISVYEKLILKFPEKSTYFAGRINELKSLI